MSWDEKKTEIYGIHISLNSNLKICYCNAKNNWEPFYLVSEKIAFLKGKNNVADKMLFSCTIVQYLPGNSRTDVIKIKAKLLFSFESLQFFFSFSFYNNHFLQSFFFWYSFLRDNLFALKKKTEKIEALFP